jgi:PHD/YefM family antitoxin component YafN of YafNO toxin-antitoxin module
MEKNMIKISLKEYEGMKETIEILQNPDTMCQILESEENIRKGKVKEFKY